MKTDKKHLQSLREILQLQRRLDPLCSELRLKSYVYKETIEYLYTMFSYLDAERVIRYGMDQLIQHVELLKILLQSLVSYLVEDKELYDHVKLLIQRMEAFLAEWRFDVSRHAIGHIGLKNANFLFNGNAYHFHNDTSAHVYSQFAQYILQGLREYITIKRTCIQLYDTAKLEDSEASLEKIRQEVEALHGMTQALERAIRLVTTVEEQESDLEKRNDLFLQTLTNENDCTQRLLFGLTQSIQQASHPDKHSSVYTKM